MAEYRDSNAVHRADGLRGLVTKATGRSSPKEHVALGATDMRKGFDDLYGIVRDRLGLEVKSGHLFLFANARRNRLKILYWDGSGLWSCAKRLERGRFTWPAAVDQSNRVALSHEELALLIGGIDLSKTRRKNWYRITASESEKE